jgi:hypothetical protein
MPHRVINEASTGDIGHHISLVLTAPDGPGYFLHFLNGSAITTIDVESQGEGPADGVVVRCDYKTIADAERG